MKRNVTVCLFSLFCICIFANQKVHIRGYVLDETQHVVEMANVYEKKQAVGAVVASTGFYEITLQKADTFHLAFSCIGYQTEERIFTSKDNSITLNITLKSIFTELNAIDVKAYKRQPTMMQKINPSDIKLIPGPLGGIEGLLSTFAGVNSTNELSSQYSVRGGNYDENSIYVNNIEIYRPQLIRAGQQEGLSFINPDMVDGVAFSSGGFDAKYGDKMSSVLDVSYKQPSKFEASVMASLLGASVYVGSACKNFTQIHGFRYKTSNYLLGTLDTKGEYTQSFFDYQTYLTFRFSPKWSGSFLGNISQNIYRFLPKNRETTFGTYQEAKSFKVYFEGQEHDSFGTYFGAFTLNYKPLKSLDLALSFSAFNTSERETYDITGEYWLSDVDVSSGAIGIVTGSGTYHEHARNRLSATVANISHYGKYKIGNHSLQFGIGAQGEFIKDKISEWEFRDSAGYSLPYNIEKVDLIYSLNSNASTKTLRLNGYVQENYRLNVSHGLWYFGGGIRAGYWSFNEEWLISPRISVSYSPKLKADLLFRFASGIYYQAPFYKEIRMEQIDAQGNRMIILNREIKAQRSLHVVLGGDYNFRLWRRPFKLTLEGYYKPSDRVNAYSVDNMRIRYAGNNNAIGYTAGIDLKLFGEFVPGIDSWISVSWMRSREDVLNDSYKVYSNTGSYIGNVYPGYISRPNEQRYSISLFYQDYVPNHPEYKLYLKMIWADGLPFGAPHTERYQATFRTPPYRRVDIGASRGFEAGREKFMRNSKIVKSFYINLEIFNLLNIKNVNSYYWITDIYNNKNAVPNYLTSILFNFKVTVNF